MNPITKFLVKLLGNEKHQSFTIPVFAIVLSLIVGAVVIAVLGKNPFSAYANLMQGSGIFPKARYAGGKSMLTDFFSFMNCKFVKENVDVILHNLDTSFGNDVYEIGVYLLIAAIFEVGWPLGFKLSSMTEQKVLWIVVVTTKLDNY